MPSELMQEALEMIEAAVHSRPTPFEYELAYQARVVNDRLRLLAPGCSASPAPLGPSKSEEGDHPCELIKQQRHGLAS